MIDNATIATSTRNMFKDGSTKSSHRITISRVGDYLNISFSTNNNVSSKYELDAKSDSGPDNLVDYAPMSLQNSKFPCRIPARSRAI